MNFLKFFNKKAKEADQVEEGLRIFLDFEQKTFKFLQIDDFMTSEKLTTVIIEDLLKSGIQILINGQEISGLTDPLLKKYSGIYLIIRLHLGNHIISQRKLNFYEHPSQILNEKEKTYDYSFVFSLNENIQNEAVLSESMCPINRRNSKKGSSGGKIKASPKKKKKSNASKFENENIVRSGVLKKKTKKGDFIEKIFELYKDKLVYFEPKDKENKKNISLSYAVVQKMPEIKEKNNIFEIKTLEKSYFLQTSNNLLSWINDIRFQITMSTNNTILNEYEDRIQKRELKSAIYLQQILDKIRLDFAKCLKSEKLRDWFTTFISQTHPEHNILLSTVNLFFKSEKNRALVENEASILNETTNIFINHMFESIEKAQKPHPTKKSDDIDEFPNKTSEIEEKGLSDEDFSIVAGDSWSKIKEKFKVLKETLILESSDGLLNEIFELFRVLTERLLVYVTRYSDEFLQSEIFTHKFSQNYMRQSCLINNFWFEKPQIKMEIHRIDKSEKNNTNYLSPLKPAQRDRIMTNTMMSKNQKEYGDMAQSCLSKSLNDKL